jgi:DNA primase
LIDEITIQRIIDTSRIDEVVSEFVNLKKRGSNYIGLCPFHNEKSPSFSVSPVKGIYKCFGCGKAGNAVNFLMDHDHMLYPDALRWLAKKYNIEIHEKEISVEEIAKRDERESLFVATTFAHEFFTNTIQKTEEGKAVGLAYFHERNFRDDIIKKFELGYSPDKATTFYNHAIKSGYKPEFLLKAGLINKGNFDSFSGRVIFPIHNLSGRVVGFTGRILNKEKSPAKYYNSPESEIFHKGKILFGLYLAKKSIAEKDRCYLVEGNADVVSMHQSGIENCVASSGTALSVDQIALIKRFTKNITLLYDSDPAGIKAAIRGIDLLLEEGMHIKVVLLPEGEDPDSFAQSHSQAELFEFLNKEEKDFFAFKTTVLLKDAGKDPVKRSEVLNDIVKSLALIPDNILRSLYIKDCSRLLKIEEQLLHSEVAKRIIGKRTEYSSNVRPSDIIGNSPETPKISSIIDDFYAEEQEFEILRLIFLYGNRVIYKEKQEDDEIEQTVVKYVIQELVNDELELKNLVNHRIFEIFCEQLKSYGYIEPKELIYHTDDVIQELAADRLNTPYYRAQIKGQSDLLSKYYKRIGILVKTEDAKLKDSLPRVIIRYKIKILELVNKDIIDKLSMAQEVNASQEIIDDLLLQHNENRKILQEMYSIYGQVVR